MENNKTIIGYKLIKPQYKEAAIQIADFSKGGDIDFESFLMPPLLRNPEGSFFVRDLKTAGVLDLWFEPVYDEPIENNNTITKEEIEEKSWLWNPAETQKAWVRGVNWAIEEMEKRNSLSKEELKKIMFQLPIESVQKPEELTKREYFLGCIITGMISKHLYYPTFTKDAFTLADEIIKELVKTK